MAKPIFIYAFDNLGPRRFVELCGLLLASRHRGFLLGGVGPDGGIDAEVDQVLGEWRPDEQSALLNELVGPGQLVVFQFKHRVTARVGQAQARTQLLAAYRCTAQSTCELHSRLVGEKKPSAYALVTNVEVNSQFRSKFIEQCRMENPDIEHYQIVGLDELETWVTMAPELRHFYFPTIFGPPRFDLRIELGEGVVAPGYGGWDIDFDQAEELLQISVLNVGTVPSFVSSIGFRAIVEGESRFLYPIAHPDDVVIKRLNPDPGTPLEPGRSQTYHFRFADVALMKAHGTCVLPLEVIVRDEIGNLYSNPIPEHLRDKILAYMEGNTD
jgi:hypothetical protein